MITRQISIATPIFLLIFVIQEAVISQFRLPGGGFSILLIFALTWAVLSQPEVAAVIGFASGILMDLSQSSSGPMGHWTLIMILACYAVAFLGSGNDNVRGNPVTNIFLVSFACVVTLIAFVIIGLLLGMSAGSFSRILITIFSNGIWALLATPLILPVITRLHAVVLGDQARL